MDLKLIQYRVKSERAIENEQLIRDLSRNCMNAT